MKILFVTSHLSRTNGWGMVAVETVSRFARDGHEVTVLTDDSTEVDVGAAEIVRVRDLYSKEGGKTRGIRVLFDRVRCSGLLKKKYDLVVCMTEDLLPLAHKLAKKAKAFVGIAIGTYAVKSLRGRNRSLYMRAFCDCDVVFCISEYTQKQLNLVANDQFAPLTRVAALGCNPVMSDEEYEASLEGRKDLMIAVGHLKTRKAIVESVQAFHQFRKDFPQFEFHIIGDTKDTEYVSRVKETIRDLDLGDVVRLVGKAESEELKAYYKRAKLLLMPSINENDHFEGFGLVHLEANSWGTPTIGSTNCGHEQAVRNGFSGLLTPQRDIAAISEAMGEILGSEQRWRDYSRQAYQFSREMSWESYYREFVRGVEAVSG